MSAAFRTTAAEGILVSRWWRGKIAIFVTTLTLEPLGFLVYSMVLNLWRVKHDGWVRLKISVSANRRWPSRLSARLAPSRFPEPTYRHSCSQPPDHWSVVRGPVHSRHPLVSGTRHLWRRGVYGPARHSCVTRVHRTTQAYTRTTSAGN